MDIEKVAIKVEFEISLQHNDLAPNIHEHDVDDIHEALNFLNEEEQNVIDLLFFVR